MSSPAWDLSYTQDRELSWLQFDRRVLEEAEAPSVPPVERARFLAIFSSNLDEFFMVRVGGLCDLRLTDPESRDNKGGRTPDQQLAAIFRETEALMRRRDKVYAQLSGELASYGLRDVPYGELRGEERAFVRRYYRENIRPVLIPQIIDASHPFPHLKNKALYAAALLRDGKHRLLGVVGVPEGIPPVVLLPGTGTFVRTETILLHKLERIFKRAGRRGCGRRCWSGCGSSRPRALCRTVPWIWDISIHFRQIRHCAIRRTARPGRSICGGMCPCGGRSASGMCCCFTLTTAWTPF